MKVMGIRCSNSDFTYAIVTGGKDNPSVDEVSTVPVPKGYRHQQALDWLYLEIEHLVSHHQVEIVVLKRFEGLRRNGAFETRAEFEGVIALASYRLGSIPVFKKMARTIAKDLGLKGVARYLKTSLDTSVISGFDGYSAKGKDAILCGWSELKP